MVKLNINSKEYQIELDPNTPLLWVLRDSLELTGTKYGCGIGQCGACTVHLDGVAVRSCSVPISALVEKQITTIEAGGAHGHISTIQQAWIEEDVPQCGYCQTGQIMTASALLLENRKPNDKEIEAAMQGNLCRCGTYPRIKKAIHKASKNLKS